MKTGKIVAGVAAGTILALLMIPKTRRMITCGVSGIMDSLKSLSGNQTIAGDKIKNVPS